jgi:hypothetical protein
LANLFCRFFAASAGSKLTPDHVLFLFRILSYATLLAQALRVRRHVDDADSVENPPVRSISTTRMWTSRAATSQSRADDVESARTDDRGSS